jgi:TolB-like protein
MILASGCAASRPAGTGADQSIKEKFRIAVFPIENLSGMRAPLKDLRRLLIHEVKKNGFEVVNDNDLENLMANLRIRYTGGVDSLAGEAFRKLGSIDAILITSLEHYDPGPPPRIAIMSRLVSTGVKPEILWMDGVEMSGEDEPGFLLRNLIGNPDVLRRKALRTLTKSLSTSVSAKEVGKEQRQKAESRFRPKTAYRSPVVDPRITYKVAVLPFTNRSDRKNAGETLSLHFIRRMVKSGNFHVIEPGLIREKILTYRIIMGGDLPLNHADALMTAVGADLILTGSVGAYEDYQGTIGRPVVEFNAMMIEKKSLEIVWSSHSYNEGTDGVFFFEIGRKNVAAALTSGMVDIIVRYFIGGIS